MKKQEFVQNIFWNKGGAYISRCVDRVNYKVENILRNFSLVSSYNGEYWASEMIENGSVVFDVGFHKGEFAREVLGSNRDVKVFGFDASKKSEKHYKEKGELFKKSVSFTRSAVSNYVGEAEFYDYGNSLNSLSPRADYKDVQDNYAVRVTKLDKYCSDKNIDRIDFLKIDVEGHELDVMEGASGMMARENIGAIMFEYSTAWISSGNYIKDVVDFIENKEYDMFRLFNGFLNEFEYDVKYESPSNRSSMYVLLSEKYLSRSDITIKDLSFL